VLCMQRFKIITGISNSSRWTQTPVAKKMPRSRDRKALIRGSWYLFSASCRVSWCVRPTSPCWLAVWDKIRAWFLLYGGTCWRQAKAALDRRLPKIQSRTGSPFVPLATWGKLRPTRTGGGGLLQISFTWSRSHSTLKSLYAIARPTAQACQARYRPNLGVCFLIT